MSGFSSRNIQYPRYQDTKLLQLCNAMMIFNYITFEFPPPSCMFVQSPSRGDSMQVVGGGYNRWGSDMLVVVVVMVAMMVLGSKGYRWVAV